MARLENKKAVFSCDKCNKSFDFKCPLQADLKNHLHKCKNCNQRFRRMEQHQLSCIDTNNVQFIPSFTTLVLPTELLMNPSEFSEQVEQVVPEIDQPELDNASVSFFELSNIIEQIDSDTTSNHVVSIDRSPYWKTQKQVICKTKSLEQIVQSLTLSPLKNQLIKICKITQSQ